ncbi:hypothetical protein Dimus_008110 [Dionaea muscipula]
MYTTSSPSDPSATDDHPNAASLAIIIFEPPGTSSNPTSDIPSAANVGGSPEHSPPPAPTQNDPPSSNESDDNSDASESEDDSDDSTSSES